MQMAEQTDELLERCRVIAELCGITPLIWHKFTATINPLRQHNEDMFAHSMRVGLYSVGLVFNEDDWSVTDAAEQIVFMLARGRLPLLAGCGHDVGKCFISNEILNKTTPLTPEDWDAIVTHPIHSWEILKEEFPMTALVAGLHHTLSTNPYGIDLNAVAPDWFAEEHRRLVQWATEIVAICDFYDALTTRNNSSGTSPTLRERREIMVAKFPGSSNRSRRLWLEENLI